MKFLYPQFLYALFALVIPVIIHLFNFQRYKKVYFSNVSFLKEVKHSTKAKSNLKHLLILLSRMLAITALVFAFAQPFFPVSNQEKSLQVQQSSVFIDNSFSSQNRSKDGIVLDISRQLGIELLEELPTSVNHQLLTNSFQGDQQHLYSGLELVKKASTISEGPHSRSIQDIIKRQSTAFDSPDYRSYIISDFQKSQFEFENLVVDSNTTVTLIPVKPAKTDNISIDSVWFSNPVHRVNEEDEIHVRISNHGNQELENLSINLFIDNSNKGITNISIPENSSVDTTLKFHTNNVGWHMGYVSIDDFPIVFDNQFHFSFYIKESVNVVEINSDISKSFIQKAFETEPYFNYQLIEDSKVEFDDVQDADFVILNNIDHYASGSIASIKKFVQDGGSVAIIPSKNENQGELNQLLGNLNIPALSVIQEDSMQINQINLQHNLYKGVFTSSNERVNLPSVYKSFYFNSNSNGTHLLTAPNKQPILSEWNHGKGTVYLFSIALNDHFSNFTQHSIFLPTFFQMGFNSGFKTKPFFFIGKDELIPVYTRNQTGELIFRIQKEEFGVDFIPGIVSGNSNLKLQMHNMVQDAGSYTLSQNDSTIGSISFNYQRKESVPSCYSVNDLKMMVDSLGLDNVSVFESDIKNFKNDFSKREKGIELWKWFVILTLLFLAIEIVLIRFFKPSVL